MKKLILSIFIITIHIGCGDKSLQPGSHTISKPAAPISIEGLSSRVFESKLTFEKNLRETDTYSSALYSYDSDSLKIYTLVNTPKVAKPQNGYPVMIFGHGYHPEPANYGISNKTGNSHRPGDYYSGIPEAYAQAGYLVLTPDYRGHNISQGIEFTRSPFHSHYYTIDVLSLISAIPSLEYANRDKVFYIGHSMGGGIGLRMLLTTDKINAASLWAPTSGNTTEQSLFYGRYYDSDRGLIDKKKMDAYNSKVTSAAQALPYPFDIKSGDPYYHIDKLNTPLIIHHAWGDTSVPYIWSETLVTRLYTQNKYFQFYAYESSDHLLKNQERTIALARDLSFFKSYH